MSAKARRVEKGLRQLGFRRLPARGKGSHAIWTHGDGRFVVVAHHGGTVTPGVMSNILRAVPELRGLL